MTKLTLPPIEHDKAVRLTVMLPPPVNRDLVPTACHCGGRGGEAVPVVMLVGPMLARFMGGNRDFEKARRTASDH